MTEPKVHDKKNWKIVFHIKSFHAVSMKKKTIPQVEGQSVIDNHDRNNSQIRDIPLNHHNSTTATTTTQKIFASIFKVTTNKNIPAWWLSLLWYFLFIESYMRVCCSNTRRHLFHCVYFCVSKQLDYSSFN